MRSLKAARQLALKQVSKTLGIATSELRAPVTVKDVSSGIITVTVRVLKPGEKTDVKKVLVPLSPDDDNIRLK